MADAIPRGAAVRSRHTGRLGKVVAPAPGADRKVRAHRYVLFDGFDAPVLVMVSALDYVARRYTAAKAWEATEARRAAAAAKLDPTD